jgi:subtilase family protein/List-Bact-rpt repeat protein
MYPIPNIASWLRLLAVIAGTCALLAAGAGTAGALPLSAPPQFRPNLENGRLAPGVATALERQPSTEVIVVLDDRDVQDHLDQLRGTRRHAADDDAVIATRARLLTEKKGRLRAALSGEDHELLNDYEHFAVLHLRAGSAAIARLLDQSEVRTVEENRSFSTFLSQSLPLIRAPQANSLGATGSGTAVAVLDTGVNYTLSAFGSCSAPNAPAGCKVVYAADIAASDASLDDNGHGTNVAGIVLGVAPGSRIVALDVFRTDGFAWTSDLLTALNWVLSNRVAYNIVAVNMSLGGGQYYTQCPNDSLAGPIASLRSAGIATAIASGNEAYNGSMASPACVPAAISVGAVYDTNMGPLGWGSPLTCSDTSTAADKVTCFTNMADFLNLLAPGALITAAGTTYGGTSQATPHVAGALALLKGAHPGFTVDTIVDRLTQTGVTVSTTRQSKTYNKPRINLEAALSYPRISVGPTSHDFGTFDPATPPRTRTFTVTNAGSANLAIGTLALGSGSADFALQNNLCSGQTLPATTTCSFEVSCAPQWTADPAATLTIPSNDPDTPNLAVTLGAQLSRQALTVTSVGNGSVGSQPAGIACGGSCSATFITGTQVTLTAQPAADSTFSGWSGACSGTGDCHLTLGAPAAVTATFAVRPAMALTGEIQYGTIAAAYAAVADGDAIHLTATGFGESLSFNRAVSIDLAGGYDGDFNAITGQTVISGGLTFANGTVNLSGIELQ